jgi:hypothetical protein
MKSVIAIVNVDFVIVGMNYNHWLVFDDWMMMMMIIDFDRVVEYSTSKLMMMMNHERYFDEVMVENLLVVIQTIYSKTK